jgi:uncharacterized membrane protein YkvA (DUF1232 family)
VQRLRDWARRLQAETLALWFAARDDRTPWYAKLFVAAVVAYALSPIDLIPDFVPVLGLLDDVILIPLGVAAALRMIPADVMAAARERARLALADPRPRSRVAAAVIVAVWIAGAALAALVVWRAAR